MRWYVRPVAALLCSAILGAQQAPEEKPRENDSAWMPSTELNKVLPKWIRLGFVERLRFERLSAPGFRPDSDDHFLLHRIRVNLKIAPRPWFTVTLLGQDARVFWKKRPANAGNLTDRWDLQLVYTTIGTPEKHPLWLSVGKMDLVFGDERLLGAANWGNTARAFDAVRLTAAGKGYRVDAFAASVVMNRPSAFDHHQQGNNLHGVYGHLDRAVPDGVMEPYVLWRLAPSEASERGGRGKLDLKTSGLRTVGKLPRDFDYNTEFALQRGTLAGGRAAAWAAHALIARTLPKVRLRPRVIAEYNHATGDHDPTDGERGTFDTLYVTPHDKWGLADQVGWRNIHHVRAGVEVWPRTGWKLTTNYQNWWLAEPRDALYRADGQLVARDVTGRSGRYVGREIDLGLVFAIGKQINVYAGIAQIFPGEFLKKATQGKGYTTPLANVEYKF